jgi:Membrane carboxypeptidase (penicillin-binding protein)
MPERKRKKPVDWSDELAHSLKLVGKIMLRVFTYLFNILMTLLLIGLITGTIVGGAFAIYIKNYIDADITDFQLLFSTDQSLTTTMYYMNWEDRTNRIGSMVQIDDIKLYSSQNRVYATYDEIPENLKNAVIAIEDKRFESHDGVDWLTTIKATLSYFTGGKLTGGTSGGGSTITQQLIKNVTKYNEVTIQRKVTEIIRALKLEKAYTKAQILEMYLNTIYLSRGCYGVAAAADTYFNKDVKDLTLIECAALAAITQSPTKWDPILNPDNNKLRRDLILKEMYAQGKITLSEFNSAYDKDLVLYSGSGSSADAADETEGSSIRSIYNWYEDSAISAARDLLMEQYGYTSEVASMLVYTGGFKIVLAMDPDMQQVVENYYSNNSNFPTVDNSVIQPKSSFICIDPETGDVLALAGDRGEKNANRILNYATQTQRPPGSSIKPLSVYAPALESGLITYGSVFDDSPVNFGTETVGADGKITYDRPDGYPSNYSDTYSGLTTIHYAIRNSLNTVAYKVLQKLTLSASFDFVKNKLHINSFIDSKELTGGTVISDMDYAALALGQMNYGLTLEEITAAYSIFANKGVYNTPKIVLKILDKDGNTLIDNTGGSSIVISEQNACIMTKMLEEVVDYGTAVKLTIKDKVDVAGKTGTTSSDNDRWFIGYTPYYIAGCWFGYEMPKSLASFSASYSPALKVWDDVMTLLHQKYIDAAASGGEAMKTFTMAEGVVTAQYCKDSGKKPTAACLADSRGSRVETGYFTTDTVPTEDCDVHTLVAYDKVNGGVATTDCPASDITYVSMIKVYRSFPRQIYITDAQYVYREVSPGAALSTDYRQAFYTASLPPDTFAGTSIAGAQYNRLCSAHYKAGATVIGEYEKETEPPETEAPPPDTGYEDSEGYEDETEPDLPDDGNPPEETTAAPETQIPETEPPETSPPETEPPETETEETMPTDLNPPETETGAETQPTDYTLPDW